MKILHVVHQYAPDFVGGTELYTAKLAKEQAMRGASVAVFVPVPRTASASSASVKGPVVEAVSEDGVMVYRVFVGDRSAGRVFADQVFGSAVIVTAFQQVLAEFMPDMVHIQHLMGVSTAVVTRLQEKKIPYVVTLHDYWYGCANAQLLTNTDHVVCDGPDRVFVNCGRCALARANLPSFGLFGMAVAPLMAYRQRRLRTVLAGAQAVIAPTHFVQQIYAEMGLSTNTRPAERSPTKTR